MNKVVPILAVAFAGAAVSLVTAWRKHQLAAKVLEKEDIRRWEDEGGKTAEHGAGSSSH